MLRRSPIILLMASILILAAGCGKKVKKNDLDPDEYFEYAKGKYDNGNYTTAITEFTIMVLKFGGNPVIDDAQYYLADSYYQQKQYLVAISEFQKLINDYPQSQYVELAQFKVGMSYHNQSLRPPLDQSFTRKAIRNFQAFIEENPDHELKSNAQELISKLRIKLAEKQLIGATTYRKMGIYDSAVIYYDLIITNYYDTPQAEEAYYWKGECQIKKKKYTGAQETFNNYLEKYPQGTYVERIKKRLAEVSKTIESLDTEKTADLNE